MTVDDPGLAALPRPRPDLGDPRAAAATLAALNAHRGELEVLLGITFTEVGADRLVATMPVPGARQPYGLLHGGASCVLAETLGSVAANLHAGASKMAVGVDINATHHRSARDGTVVGTCTALHTGTRTASYGVEIRDEAGRRLCTARITCQLLPARSDALPVPPLPGG